MADANKNFDILFRYLQKLLHYIPVNAVIFYLIPALRMGEYLYLCAGAPLCHLCAAFIRFIADIDGRFYVRLILAVDDRANAG